MFYNTFLGSPAKEIKMWMKNLSPQLPYDAEVEYLESTGTQWINTGVYGSQSVGAEVKVMWREIAP